MGVLKPKLLQRALHAPHVAPTEEPNMHEQWIEIVDVPALFKEPWGNRPKFVIPVEKGGPEGAEQRNKRQVDNRNKKSIASTLK